MNSSRKEQIEKASEEFALNKDGCYDCFITGAEWADKNLLELTAEDFKKELEGKRIIWPQAWHEIANVANKLYKEKQCK